MNKQNYISLYLANYQRVSLFKKVGLLLAVSATLSCACFFIVESIPLVIGVGSALFSLCLIGLRVNDWRNRIVEMETIQRLFLEHSSEGIITLDFDGTILTANSICEKIFDTPIAQLIGQQIIGPNSKWKFLTSDEQTCPPDLFPPFRALTTGKSVLMEPMRLKKNNDQELWLKISSIPILTPTDKSTGQVLSIVLDATELQLAKKTIDDQTASLMIASRMTSLGEIAAGVSHEIVNPIAIILARTSIMARSIRRGNLDQQDLQIGIDQIQKTALRIRDIINSMRALARQKLTDQYENTSLQDLYDQVVDFMLDKFNKQGIVVTAEIPKDASFDCIPGLFGQVLIHLFVNSVEALVKSEEKWIHFEAQFSGENLRIQITDGGAGIPKELKNRIMLPFFSTKESGMGSGMGLSLVKSIVESHSGTFYLDEHHRHTRFVIEVPRRQIHQQPVAS